MYKFFCKKHFEACFILILLTSIFYLSCCFLYHVSPFGSNMIDTSDFRNQLVPFYYHIYDVLHGEKSAFFDFNTGLGSNLSGLYSHYALFHPLNLLFLLIPRVSLEPFMTWYLLFKFILIALSMYFFLSYHFTQLPTGYAILFCLLYTFSGFTVQYYALPMWLDAVALLPLLTHFLLLLLEKQKIVGYCITLSYIFICTLMQGYMYILYIIFFVGGYLFFVIPRSKRSNAILSLGFGTLIAILLSSFIALPGGLQIFRSARMNKELSLVNIFTSIDFTSREKWLMISNLGFPAFFFLLKLVKYRFTKNSNRFYFYMITILCFPILLESTNLLWHMGSYVNFSMRFAYMLIFIVIISGADALQEYCPFYTNHITKHLLPFRIIVLLLGLFTLPFLLYICKNNKGIFYICFLLFFSILILFAAYVLFSDSLFYLTTLIGGSLSIFILLVGLFSFHEPTYPDYIRDSNLLNDHNLSYSPFDRLKNADSALDPNYPFIVAQPSMSNYIHLVSPEQISLAKALGYTQTWTSLRDTGGTLFSDMLLGYKNTVSIVNQPLELYQETANINSYHLYHNKDYWNTGIILPATSLNDKLTNLHSDPFINQNNLAKIFLGQDIFELYNISDAFIKPRSFNIKEKSIIYFYGENLENINILVNNKPIFIPVPADFKNILYPSDNNNGIISLGIFENETVKIKFEGDTNSDANCHIAICSLTTLRSVAPTYSDTFFMNYKATPFRTELSITTTVNQSEASFLYLPLYACDGWQCTVNGNLVDIQTLYDSLMLIPVIHGVNTIKLYFLPPGIKSGIIITLVGITLLIFSNLLQRYLENFYFPAKVCYFLFTTLFIILLSIFYIIPILLFFPSLFK